MWLTNNHADLHKFYVCSISDELVDWDPWQPAAVVIDGEDGNGPHCDDPDFNVRRIT